MAACYPTATAEDAGSSGKTASVATPAPEPNTVEEDLTTPPGQDDVKTSWDKVGTAPEPSTMDPTAQPPTAVSPASPMKEKGPSLLKLQHKTALKDFIVSTPPASYQQLPTAHVILENIFFLNMARQGVAPGRSPGFNRGWCHHAGNEHHFWYESSLQIISRSLGPG